MPTTGISLIREHTAQLQVPRFLWVPFELGRPFGAPHEPEFQRRVLRTALELLERDDGPVVLEDFPEDAPDLEPSDGEQVGWSCPIAFRPPPADEELPRVTAVQDELKRLAPWHEIYVEERGRAAPASSGLELGSFVRLLGLLAEGVADPQVESELPIQEWIRLGCDDLRTWYVEAAQGQPGRATSAELRDWFWRDTAAAHLIAAAAQQLTSHPEPFVRGLALRAMVPRPYFPLLIPDVDPSS